MIIPFILEKHTKTSIKNNNRIVRIYLHLKKFTKLVREKDP